MKKSFNQETEPLKTALIPYVEENKTYCVAVSGGIDSVALLHCLIPLCKRTNTKLIGLHFNHHLRAEESDNDEVFCKELCDELSIPCEVGHADVQAVANKEKISLEDAARKCRFRWLTETAKRYIADAIFLAHHADDQAETVLLRLLRGAGVHGLAGIRRETRFHGVPILRPWLDIPKSVIQDWCQNHSITARYDSSNDDQKMDRNWVRHTLIPLLNEHCEQNTTERLIRTAAICRAADSAIHSVALQCIEEHGFHSVLGTCIARSEIAQQEDAILQEIIRIMTADDEGKPICNTYDKVIYLEDKIRSSQKNWSEYIEPHTFVGCMENTFYAGRKIRECRMHEVHLNEVNSFALPAGMTLTITPVVQRGEAKSHNGEGWQKACNSDNEICMTQFAAMKEGEWCIRPRRKGDVYTLLNGAQKKIKDMYIDAYIPHVIRHIIPLVTCDDHIVWVAGWRIAEESKVEPGQSCLKLELSIPRNTP